MNLILFSPGELGRPLPRNDPRAVHLLGLLGRGNGDAFDAGLINGPRGKGVITSFDEHTLALEFTWGEPLPPLPPLTLIVGTPRPQAARHILRDATTLGATRLAFVQTARSDPNYAASRLWTSGEWQRHLIAGAEQAFDTRIPEVSWTGTLQSQLAALATGTHRLALDNYEAAEPLAVRAGLQPGSAEALAIGPERGWTEEDRVVLRTHHFTLCHLGPRVLRTETAVVAALSLLNAQRALRGG